METVEWTKEAIHEACGIPPMYIAGCDPYDYERPKPWWLKALHWLGIKKESKSKVMVFKKHANGTIEQIS